MSDQALVRDSLEELDSNNLLLNEELIEKFILRDFKDQSEDYNFELLDLGIDTVNIDISPKSKD